MNPIIVVPARMASKRLPGKPLMDIGGKPMIVRVLERCREANIGPVIVATPDKEIAAVAVEADFGAVITDGGLASGSDAVWAAAQKHDPRHDVIINVQGDQVGITPEHIRASLIPLDNQFMDIGTLVAEEKDQAFARDENVVKAFVDLRKTVPNQGRAWYFFRGASPSYPVWRHIGVYAYRRKALEVFSKLQPTTSEKHSRLEQMRAIENDLFIGCAVVDSAPDEVNTQADLDRVLAKFAEGALH